jgi:hypothetical protein
MYCQGSTAGFVYYVVADRRMPQPNHTDTRWHIRNTWLNTTDKMNGTNQTGGTNETYYSNVTFINTSNPIFGEAYLKLAPFQQTFTIYGLQYGHSYVIYTYMMNMNRVYNVTPWKNEFTTLRKSYHSLLNEF